MAKEVDYLIVGGGVTGRLLQIELMKRGLKALVFDKLDKNHSTQVAAGLVNPVVGKFFTVGWRAEEFFPSLAQYYRAIEHKLNASFFKEKPMKRIIANAGEQNIWLSKAHLSKYVDFCSFKQEKIKGLNTDWGVLQILQSGEMNTHSFLEACNANLPSIFESFDASQLDIEQKKYHMFSYRNIIFCEGYESINNPFFKDYLSVIPTKGELLEICAEGIPDDCIYLGAVFLQPKGKNRWTVGATYEKNQTSLEPTDMMKSDLETKLNKLIRVPYSITKHYCGIRPASIDRKPLMGKHPTIDSMYTMNGMGSKAISMVPLLAQEMVNYMEHHIPLSEEINLNRFF